MNLVEAELGDGVVTFGSHTIRVDDSVLGARPGLRSYAGRTVALGIRPEDVEDAGFAADRPADARLSVTVDIKEDMGSEVILHFAVDARPVKTEAVAEVVTAEAIDAGVAQAHEGTPFVARVDRSTQAREGERVELAVDTRRLHFFDLETGEGIYDEVVAPAPVAA
jgi:multiple sugar transport system ATP-binding protein